MTAPDEQRPYRLVRRSSRPPIVPELDPEQRRVVEHRGGRMLVLAGPGTGKTTTLVEAALARVEAGVPIEELLMLTFSRRAATELRDRITARLGRTVREPIARTFHSYAFGVLRMSALANGLPSPRLLAGPEQDVVLRELIAGDAERGRSPWPQYLQAATGTRAFAGELRDLLLRAVERGLDGDDLAELGRRKSRADWQAAAEFLQQYQEVTSLSQPGAWDPAELIRAATDALGADDALLAAERRQRRHIFVDEYQDTDPAQVELLSLIAAGSQELIVVGDPDQSIYAFRGTDSTALSDFEHSAANVETVALRTSRRSGNVLLAASRAVARRLPGPVGARALAAAPGTAPGRVQVAMLRSASEEASFVAATLRRAHLEDGLPWSRMAVIVRSTRNSLAVLRRAMVTAGVPVAVAGEDVPLAEQPAVAHLLTALGCVLRPESLTNEIAETLLLGPIGGADSLQLRRLRRELRQRPETTDLELGQLLAEPLTCRILTGRAAHATQQVADVLEAGRVALSQKLSAEEVLWAVWDATGLARRWFRSSQAGGAIGSAADRDLDSVIALFDSAARFADRLPGASVAEFYEHLAAQQIPGDSLADRSQRSEAVQVLTAHASKGLEWDLVCVAGVQEGVWPDVRRRGSLLGADLLVDVVAGRDGAGVSLAAPQLAEERRLFYVAITRARVQLVVTAVSGEDEQPSRFLDEIDPVDGEREYAAVPRGVHLPAVVAQLRAVVCDPSESSLRVEAAAEELARLAEAGVAGADPRQWWGILPLSSEEPVADPQRPVPLSPSHLDSFLRCEVQTLLRQFGARKDDQLSASLGTLIHEVAAIAPPEATLADFEALLDERWHRLDFGAAWVGTHQRLKARKMLGKLLEWLTSKSSQLVAVEESFSIEVVDAVLRGRVDRLERDAQGRLVVVDYKTGSSKAKTDTLLSNPQLATYQLAVEGGGFSRVDDSTEAGGAMLVQLGDSAASVGVQPQPPLAEHEDPAWIAETVAEVAAKMRDFTFVAAQNDYCRVCDVKASCPLTPSGRQVTS
ncbi:Superfamily I DNA or RNA helicase [Frankineae bacterium MT45]|nr:Superfamily I DNA or RNA helicase [Frankineae bacterium MT45]